MQCILGIDVSKKTLDVLLIDLVKIKKGPMKGYTAIFDANLQGHERVKVLLELMSDRKVALELRCDAIE